MNARLVLRAGLGLLFLMAGSRAAFARDRLAVAIVAAGDAELSDNLTEAAISSLAERGDEELVGTRELRRRLADDPSAPDIETCVVQPACLARVAAAAGARRAVVGEVHKDEAGFVLQMALVSTDTGARDAVWSCPVQGDTGSFVAAVATGVRALFAADAARPKTAAVRLTPAPDALAAGGGAPALHLETGDGSKRGNARAAYLGIAALALAVVAFSAAAVTGNTAAAPLLGTTRADMQADLRRREDYALATNGLLAAGGALSLTAGALFVWWWRSDRTSSP